MSFKDKYLKYKNKYLNIKQIRQRYNASLNLVGQRYNASLNLVGQRCNASLNLVGGTANKAKLSANSIKNYTYILVNSNGTIISEEDYKNIYNNIILKYHYPICLNATLELTEAEKNSIKIDEFAFIKTKITIPDIEIFQIPRILYDMLFILYRHTKLLDSENDLKSFKFDRVFLNINYIKYCNHLNNLHQEILEGTCKLNNYIIKYLQIKKINLKEMTYLEYTLILNSIIRDYIDLKLKLLIINEEIEKEIEILKTKPKVQPILIEKDIEILEIKPKVQSILINNYPESNLILKKLDIKSINNNFINLINSLNEKLLHKVLIEETISSLNSKNKIILYRGSQDIKESVINEENNNQGYSLSYNTSILNGFFHDITACTYYFMNNLMHKSKNRFKHYYNLNRFFYGDNSVEDNLFFIPPFHPYLQMISEDEFWHARSKVFTGSDINNLPYFADYYDDYFYDYDLDYIPEKFEDFLQTIEEIWYKPSKTFIGKYTNETTMPIYQKIHKILLNHQQPINTINDLSEVLKVIYGDIDIWYLYKKLYPLKYDRVGYPDSKFPDYLTSKYDKTKMDNEFKKFINSHRSQIQDTAEIEHVESNLFGGNIL